MCASHAPHSKSVHHARVQRAYRSLTALICLALLVLVGAYATGSVPGRTVPADQLGLHSMTAHRILFVGASYTYGLGATPHTEGYAYQVGRDLGWPVQVAGVAGTGFLNPGPHHQGTFAQRLAGTPRSFDPGLIVLQGGRNDIPYPTAELRTAVTHTIALARARFPQARVALLGPIPVTAPVGPGARRVADVMRQACAAQGAVFIDPIAEGWITAANAVGFQGNVPDHPNNLGYAFIADRLSDDIARLAATRRD
jgi:acyl-CoA thioesterase-1